MFLYNPRVKIEDDFVGELVGLPIAQHQSDANEQHYEVPAEFFQIVLGPKLKYSACLFHTPKSTLTEVLKGMPVSDVTWGEPKNDQK